MKYLLLIIVLILVAGVGFYFGGGLKFVTNESNLDVRSTVKEIIPISEYASLVYHYTDVINHSDALKLFSFGNIPFTEKRAIYTIDGTVKLGFDGKDVNVKKTGNTIILQMPAIKVLSHEILPETFNLYDEKSGLFNSYTIKEVYGIQLTQKIEREIKIYENRDLFFQARESAELMFRSLLESIPEIKNNYTILFEWENQL